jgi:hypothetical protein
MFSQHETMTNVKAEHPSGKLALSRQAPVINASQDRRPSIDTPTNRSELTESCLHDL